MSIHNFLSDWTQADWNIPDPGDAGSIDTIQSGICHIVTAGAETRTLPAPARTGQMMVLVLKTDGGDATVTITGGCNVAGNTSAVFADAGDTLILLAIDDAGTVRWQVWDGNDGVSLS